jgi:ankyrin repeat protein
LGAEYEILIPAYFALKLNNEDVQDFSIQSNVKNFGNMDDVVISISMKNKQKFRFAIQLKHKDNPTKKLSPRSFETIDSAFSLKKYCKAFKNLSEQNKECHFILYTNAEFDPKRIGEVTNFTMIEDHHCEENMLFNTSSRQGNVYRFETNENTPNDEELTKSDYEQFLSKLTVFLCQKNVRDLQRDITTILQNKNEALCYVDLFRNWHRDMFATKTIDKTTVNIFLIDTFLSPFMITNRYLSIREDEKLKLFDKLVKTFDVTLINNSFPNFNEYFAQNYCDLEGDIREKCENYKELYKMGSDISTDECLMRLAKQSKIVDKYVTKLEAEEKLKVLHYFFEKPLIVDFNKNSEKLIYQIMELHQLEDKIKFILVGEGIQSAKLSRFRVFKNLNDLSINETLYKEVIRTCRLSVQGRDETTLENLIESCEEIGGCVEPREIFQMLRGHFLVGQQIESLPRYYIDRKISVAVLQIHTILNDKFLAENLPLIDFAGRIEQFQDKCLQLKINVVDVDHYLRSTEISTDSTIIATNKEFSKQLLQDISKKGGSKSILFLRLIDDHSFSVVMSRRRLLKDLPLTKVSIEEQKMYNLSTSPVNILCAGPGMGKSTLLKKLRTECDSKFWSIGVDLKAHNEFFKVKLHVNELLNSLLEGVSDGFSKKITNIYRLKKKVIFFLDGLDEIESKSVNNVLRYVEELSSLGFHVWVFSRKTLKEKLEARFDMVTFDMEEVDKDQQNHYIKNRLQEEYSDEEIENIISKIFSSTSDIVNNCQILGIPLQLFIITQTFLDDKDLYRYMTENIFLLTKMYNLFFAGKIKHSLDKLESKYPHLELAKSENVLKKYEILALESLFDMDVFKTLNVETNVGEEFLTEIKENKDLLGIVVKVNSEGKAVFEHYTYAEYFAAVFFASNFDKARIIEKELFSTRYKNVMMIFNIVLAEENPLHLAVIYRDVQQIVKHSENKSYYDRGGRNPLHIAACAGPDLNNFTSHVHNTDSAKTKDYLKNITILYQVVKFNYNERDSIFQWNALDYAFKNDCLVSAEMILKEHGCSKEVYKYIKKHKNNSVFCHWCLTHGCKNLLSLMIDSNKKSEDIIRRDSCYLVQHTIKNCYFQEGETLRYLIDILRGIPRRRFKSHLVPKCSCLNLRRYRNGNHDKHFDVNFTEERESFLHFAIKCEKIYAVRLLIATGASVNAMLHNVTPLHLAVMLKKRKFILEKIEPVNSARTSLTLAANNEQVEVEIVRLLIKYGASVNAVIDDNVTPLHLAIYSGDVGIAQLLIENGATVDALLDNNVSPLHLAVSKNIDMVKLLLDHGAPINAVTDHNVTPLHLAIVEGDMAIIQLLIDKGASINSATNHDVRMTACNEPNEDVF